MKYLIGLFFLFLSTSLIAAEEVFDIELFFQNAMKLCASVGGITGAILLAVIVFGFAVMKIAKYFEDRGKREREKDEADKRVMLIQSTNYSLMQKHGAAAQIKLLDGIWKSHYQNFVSALTIAETNPDSDNGYPLIYAKIDKSFYNEIAKVIYNKDDKLTKEEKAGLLIGIMKGKTA